MKEQLIALFEKHFIIPGHAHVESSLKSFSLTERIFFFVFAGILTISALGLVWKLNNQFLVAVPSHDGSLTEGVVGSAYFINPLFATSDVEKDLTTLIYSGLLKTSPDGSLQNDLAEHISVSEDGRVYTVTLKQNTFFHDGKPLTTDDIEFTIKKAIDPGLKSPRRANWEGVFVEKLDAKTIRFTLHEPYAAFLENLTIGILPKHIWNSIVESEQFKLSKYNTQPIGSGPYSIKKVLRNKDNSLTGYELESSPNYSAGEAYIQTITMMFYQSEEEMLAAFAAGDIESIHSVSAEELSRIKRDGTQTIHTPLPRIFGVFFNQTNAPVFANTEVKAALALVTDREQIVQGVFSGYAEPIYEPLPLSIVGLSEKAARYPETVVASTTPAPLAAKSATFAAVAAPSASSTRERAVYQARELLRKNGWKPNAQGIMEKTVKKDTYTLQFTISTSNAPDLVKTAELIKKQWEEIGAKVETKYYELADLNQLVIKPRKYDALLFGEIIGRDLDLFAFWHSSQRNDPGLNIALYTNSKADKMLEAARTATNQEERLKQFKLFNEEVTKDVPAIFLYAPEFIYVLPDTIQNFRLDAISSPADRFANIHRWYTATENVWNIPAFTKDHEQENN